ncbi:MAG TPA: hypothetical protein VKA46_38845 [Gemmataceae bacterium]|nr:hypothetical protein [Gemmataceae bacterium]
MRRDRIETGRFYTKNHGLFAREVIGDDGRNVIYRDYSLSDGRPISTRSQCQYSSFSSRAERECTAAEKARCDVAAMQRKTQEESDQFRGILEIPMQYAMFKILDAMKLEYILAYLDAKGYAIRKRE